MGLWYSLRRNCLNDNLSTQESAASISRPHFRPSHSHSTGVDFLNTGAACYVPRLPRSLKSMAWSVKTAQIWGNVPWNDSHSNVHQLTAAPYFSLLLCCTVGRTLAASRADGKTMFNSETLGNTLLLPHFLLNLLEGAQTFCQKVQASCKTVQRGRSVCWALGNLKLRSRWIFPARDGKWKGESIDKQC